jgi:hypothetical protein
VPERSLPYFNVASSTPFFWTTVDYINSETRAIAGALSSHFPAAKNLNLSIRLYPYAMSHYATSEEARKDGNKFFLEQDFVEGQSGIFSDVSSSYPKHRSAACLPESCRPYPNDWRPSWNISAVHFELGNYNHVVAITSKVLDGIHQMQEPDRPIVLQRLVKSLLLRKRYSQAKERLAALGESPEKVAFRGANASPTLWSAYYHGNQQLLGWRTGVALHEATHGRRC